MFFLKKKFENSPELARFVPFGVFVALTYAQEKLGLGEDAKYWLYLVKTLVGAWLILEMRPFVEEMRWKLSWEAVVVGIVIFALWVGLDGLYPRLTKLKTGWNPHDEFGEGVAWFYVAVRIIGSSLVVPPLEEVFYRSFLYRYLVKTDFRAIPFNQYHGLSFFVTSIIFGLMHPDRWVAGIICGIAFQWLVIRKNRLGDAMTAHAITNFLLGIWVIWKGAWNFW